MADPLYISLLLDEQKIKETNKILFDYKNGISLRKLTETFKSYKIEKLSNSYIVIPKECELLEFSNSAYYHSSEKECLLCKSKFNYGQENKKTCGLCKLFIPCLNARDNIHYFECLHRLSLDDLKLLKENKPLYKYCGNGCSNIGTGKNTKNITKAHKNNSKDKFCKLCNCETYHLIGVGCVPCHNKSDLMVESVKRMMKNRLSDKSQKCKICNSVGYVDSFMYGIDCGCSKIRTLEHNRRISKMNKSRIYNLKDSLKDIKIEIKSKTIEIENILSGIYDKRPGVWSLWSNNECLTVGQSIDMGKELKWTIRVLNNKNLEELEKENPNSTGGWFSIQSKENLKYRIILLDEESFDIREKTEAAYAIMNNATYWNASPTQSSFDFSKELKEEMLNFEFRN